MYTIFQYLKNKFHSFSIFKSSIIYLIGSIINSLLPFLLIPILTRYLCPEDYGIVATSMVLIQILSLIIGFNASGLIARSYYENINVFKSYISTNITVSILITLLLTIFLWIFKSTIGELSKFPANWLVFLPIIALFTVILTIYLTLLQVKEQAKTFILYNIIQTSLNLLISLIFVVRFSFNWRGRLLAILISGFIVASLCVYFLIHKHNVLKFKVNRESLNGLLSFSLPLIPHFIGGWVLTMAPRIFLNHMNSLSDTGLFSIGYNFASPIALVIGAGNQAYLPKLFNKLSIKTTNKLKLSRSLILLSISLPIISMLYCIFSYYILPLVVGPKFHDAAKYIFWLGMSFAAQGIYFIFGNFVIYSKKTYLLSWRGDFLGGCAMLVLCPILIYYNGSIGAAQATCISFIISMSGCIYASFKAVEMPWMEAMLSFSSILTKNNRERTN